MLNIWPEGIWRVVLRASVGSLEEGERAGAGHVKTEHQEERLGEIYSNSRGDRQSAKLAGGQDCATPRYSPIQQSTKEKCISILLNSHSCLTFAVRTLKRLFCLIIIPARSRSVSPAPLHRFRDDQYLISNLKRGLFVNVLVTTGNRTIVSDT